MNVPPPVYGEQMVWRSLAALFVAYGVLSAACVMDRHARPVLRRIVGWLSVAAVALGALHVGSTIQSAGNPGHFEGYVLLIGVILVGHGLIALAYVHRQGPDAPHWRANR